MKSTAAALALLPLLALGAPLAGSAVEKRSYTCGLTGSNVRYHVSPSTGSAAPGEFGATGTKVTFTCWTEDSSGADIDWVRDTAGYYVDFEYISSECFANIQTHC